VANEKTVRGSYDIQRWLMEYSNDSLDFSTEGIANQCIEYIHEMQRNLSLAPNSKIDGEFRSELNTNLESLIKKLNELVMKGKNNAGF
jgi:hypothetical protein